MDVYMLTGRCEHGAFCALLDVCFEYGDSFSLRFDEYPYVQEGPHPLETRLAPYLVEVKNVDEWFGYYKTPVTQHIFHAIPETQKLLKTYCSSIYFTEEIDENLYRRPYFKYSDLCFFRGTDLLLGTVSHEHMAYIYTHNDELWIDLLNAGHWIGVDASVLPQFRL